MGPLVSADQLATVERYVALGREEGARIVTGGERITLDGLEGGFYYPPTIFADVKNNMRIAQEEIFGPVVCVIPYESDEEAIAIANDSIYGLAGGVFTSNPKRALLLTDKGVKQAGLAQMVENNLIEYCVGVYDDIRSDPDLAAIDKAVEYARSLQTDCIVSVGGGSVIDSGKAMCVTLTNGGKANDHLNLIPAIRSNSGVKVSGKMT